MGETGTRCSSTGCGEAAVWAVNWRNPRIHGLDRVKVWLACDAHRGTLSGYLSTRGFPVVVTAAEHPADLVPDGAVPDGAVPDGAVPDGAVPDGAVPDGAVPDGAVPDGAVPDGAVP